MENGTCKKKPGTKTLTGGSSNKKYSESKDVKGAPEIWKDVGKQGKTRGKTGEKTCNVNGKNALGGIPLFRFKKKGRSRRQGTRTGKKCRTVKRI